MHMMVMLVLLAVILVLCTIEMNFKNVLCSVLHSFKICFGISLQQDAFGEGVGTSGLLDSYHLDDEAEKNTATEGLGEQVATFLSCAYFCD
jgi:hypothetical protein